MVVSPASVAPGASRVLFLAGLLDWHSTVAPSPAAIAGAGCLAQAKLHYEGIAYLGSKILGVRTEPLEPWYFRGANHPENSHVLRGLDLLRPQLADDDCLPVISVWGYNVPRILAEKRFLARSTG